MSRSSLGRAICADALGDLLRRLLGREGAVVVRDPLLVLPDAERLGDLLLERHAREEVRDARLHRLGRDPCRAAGPRRRRGRRAARRQRALGAGWTWGRILAPRAAAAAAELTRPKARMLESPVHEIPSEPSLSLFLSLSLLASVVQAQSANQPPALLSDLVDVSRDFRDYTNAYYLADSLARFDAASGTGEVAWKRHHLYPRLAFDNMEAVLRPFEGEVFPAASTRRTRSFPSRSSSCPRGRCGSACAPAPPVGKTAESLMLVAPPGRDTSWKHEAIPGGHRYLSAHGSVTVTEKPWHVEFRDARGVSSPAPSTRATSRTRSCPRCRSRTSAAPPTSRGVSPPSSRSRRGRRSSACGESFTRLDKRGPARRALGERREGRGERADVQAHPVLPEQPRLRHVRPHLGPRHLRHGRDLRRQQRAPPRRRGARPLRLPRRARKSPGRVHALTGKAPMPAALVVRPLDEPHHATTRRRRCAAWRPSSASTASRAT